MFEGNDFAPFILHKYGILLIKPRAFMLIMYFMAQLKNITSIDKHSPNAVNDIGGILIYNKITYIYTNYPFL